MMKNKCGCKNYDECKKNPELYWKIYDWCFGDGIIAMCDKNGGKEFVKCPHLKGKIDKRSLKYLKG